MTEWQLIVATINAMAEAITAGVKLTEVIRKHLDDPNLAGKANTLQDALSSTFSKEEIDSILARLKHCEEQYQATGDGKARVKCFCFVLRNVKDGNGGVMPDIDDWRQKYEQLGCAA